MPKGDRVVIGDGISGSMVLRLRRTFANEARLGARARRLCLLAVLLAQTVFFFLFLHRPLTVQSDNNRYETPAYNLSIGRGLSMPLSISRDQFIYDRVCARHAELCGADTTHPTAMYPPGYSFFQAAVYVFFGRSLAAVMTLQFVSLLAMFVVFERIAAKFLDPPAYLFAMGICCAYPFLARSATLLMSDHLHTVAFFLAVAALMLMRPRLVRGLLFGALMGFATLTRPYSLLVFPVLLLVPTVWQGVNATRQERWGSAVAFAVPLLLWVARNAYLFGLFIPLSSGGPGVLLMHTSLEWEPNVSRYDAGVTKNFYADLEVLTGGQDQMSYEGSRILAALAKERIKQHPFKFAAVVATHVPKLWVSLGTAAGGVSRYWPLLVFYLGGLLCLGVVGLWLKRRDPRWHLPGLAILSYWAFLLYSPGEARRTLPLRLFMLLFASYVVSQAIRRGFARKPTTGTAHE